jgi:hypothetical protein
MRLVLKELNVQPLAYNPKNDPTRQQLNEKDSWFDHFSKREWTIGQRVVSNTRKRLNIETQQKSVKKPRRKKDESDEETVKKEESEDPEEPLAVKKEQDDEPVDSENLNSIRTDSGMNSTTPDDGTSIIVDAVDVTADERNRPR